MDRTGLGRRSSAGRCRAQRTPRRLCCATCGSDLPESRPRSPRSACARRSSAHARPQPHRARHHVAGEVTGGIRSKGTRREAASAAWTACASGEQSYRHRGGASDVQLHQRRATASSSCSNFPGRHHDPAGLGLHRGAEGQRVPEPAAIVEVRGLPRVRHGESPRRASSKHREGLRRHGTRSLRVRSRGPNPLLQAHQAKRRPRSEPDCAAAPASAAGRTVSQWPRRASAVRPSTLCRASTACHPRVSSSAAQPDRPPPSSRSDDSGPRESGRHLAAQDLAHRVGRQLVDEHDPARHLVGGQRLARVRPQLVRLHRDALDEHHRGDHLLATVLVREAHHRHVHARRRGCGARPPPRRGRR